MPRNPEYDHFISVKKIIEVKVKHIFLFICINPLVWRYYANTDGYWMWIVRVFPWSLCFRIRKVWQKRKCGVKYGCLTISHSTVRFERHKHTAQHLPVTHSSLYYSLLNLFGWEEFKYLILTFGLQTFYINPMAESLCCNHYSCVWLLISTNHKLTLVMTYKGCFQFLQSQEWLLELQRPAISFPMLYERDSSRFPFRTTKYRPKHIKVFHLESSTLPKPKTFTGFAYMSVCFQLQCFSNHKLYVSFYSHL